MYKTLGAVLHTRVAVPTLTTCIHPSDDCNAPTSPAYPQQVHTWNSIALHTVHETDRTPFYESRHTGSSTRNINRETTAVSFSAILSCDCRFGTAAVCVDGINKGKATETLAS